MNRAVFKKVLSRCVDQQDIELFVADLKQKIDRLKRPEEEKKYLHQLLGEVAEEKSTVFH